MNNGSVQSLYDTLEIYASETSAAASFFSIASMICFGLGLLYLIWALIPIAEQKKETGISQGRKISLHILVALAIFFILPTIAYVNLQSTQDDQNEALATATRDHIEENIALDEYEMEWNFRPSEENYRIEIVTELGSDYVEFEMLYDNALDLLRPVKGIEASVELPIIENSTLAELEAQDG